MQELETNVSLVAKWTPPEEDDARILGMPNVPRPLHGQNCQPRTFYGKTVWDYMRKKCYVANSWKCCVCGAEGGVDVPVKEINAHEVFDIDYVAGESRFVRCVCVCAACHAFIHSGRLVTLYKDHDRYTPKSRLLSIIESGLRHVYGWNQSHPDEPPIKVYSTILSTLDMPDVAAEVQTILSDYPVEFYKEDQKRVAKWKQWHVVIGDNVISTPYKSYKDWMNKMETRNKKEQERRGTHLGSTIPHPKLTLEDYADLSNF